MTHFSEIEIVYLFFIIAGVVILYFGFIYPIKTRYLGVKIKVTSPKSSELNALSCVVNIIPKKDIYLERIIVEVSGSLGAKILHNEEKFYLTPTKIMKNEHFISNFIFIIPSSVSEMNRIELSKGSDSKPKSFRIYNKGLDPETGRYDFVFDYTWKLKLEVTTKSSRHVQYFDIQSDLTLNPFKPDDSGIV